MAKRLPFVMGTFNYPGLTHSQRVCRLYRATLQNLWSYNWDDMATQRRDMLRVRYLVDKNKDVSVGVPPPSMGGDFGSRKGESFLAIIHCQDLLALQYTALLKNVNLRFWRPILRLWKPSALR